MFKAEEFTILFLFYIVKLSIGRPLLCGREMGLKARRPVERGPLGELGMNKNKETDKTTGNRKGDCCIVGKVTPKA